VALAAMQPAGGASSACRLIDRLSSRYAQACDARGEAVAVGRERANLALQTLVRVVRPRAE
jgi:hypothetical protein